MAQALSTWGPAAGWAAVLFLLSSIPGSAIDPDWSWLDKAAHVAVYSVLGAALAFGRWRGGGRPAVLVLLGMGVLYAASDEVHQLFVPGRHADIWDWVADAVGVALGIGIVHALTRGRSTGDDEIR